jgi:4-amino-4-deoxy-L-arabinose transferase-like glycosyltransferase
MIIAINRVSILWTILWIAVTAMALFSRPLMPIDETRYLSVAWEMWLSKDFLVPHLNGEVYSHKPPLLFWLINLGWSIFGVNEWWPRLVAPLFGLANLFLTAKLSQELWPRSKGSWIQSMAPLILFGGFFWAIFTTLTMFDMILTAFSLLGLIGIVRAWTSDSYSGFALMGLSIGLGLLTKGPAILLHVLPVALLAPIWGTYLQGSPVGPSLTRWIFGILSAVLIGAAIGLLWAFPASLAGGEEYRDAIFWGQSAGRIISSFAHSRPWWWYFSALPLTMLPWIIWPTMWHAFKQVLCNGPLKDGGLIFCLSCFAPALIVFSLISGKQLHYLLPELPLLAIAFARLLEAENINKQVSPLDFAPLGILAIIFSAFLFMIPILPFPDKLLPWWGLVAPGWGLLLAIAGIILMTTSRFSLSVRIGSLAVFSSIFVVSIHLAMSPALYTAFDLKPLAIRLAEWQSKDIPLANFSKYHGQYNFLGRLSKPIAQVGMFSPDTEKFVQAHPNGKIIAYHDKPIQIATPSSTHRFRSRLIAVWDASVVALYPSVTDR